MKTTEVTEPKTVLDVGNCGPDHGAIKSYLSSTFGVRVLQADAAADALKILQQERVDLVLVNRKLDIDYSDGLEVIRQIKAAPAFASIPVMLITNYEEHQQLAQQLGAVAGFGKLSMQSPETRKNLNRFLTSGLSQDSLSEVDGATSPGAQHFAKTR